MKLGLHIASSDWIGGPEKLGATMIQVAEAAEAAGFDSIDLADHVWQHPIMGGPLKNEIEAYTTLGFIAARTQKVRLFALATAASYRHPGLLAKMVSTLDVLSGGRAMLCAGDFEEEAVGLGLPFPSLRDRFEILEETIQVCLQMWEGEHGSDQPFDGKHVQIGRALNLPQSLSRPHPRILIAGSGEKKTLPLVARYADACNIKPGPDIPRQLELLRSLCEKEGRDYDAIEKTAPFGFDVGPNGEKVDELLGRLRWLGSMGIENVLGWVVNVDQIKPLEIMAREVIPAAKEIPTKGR